MYVQKVTSYTLLFIFVLSIYNPSFANEDTEQNFLNARSYINSVQIVNPNLPTTVSSQKGTTGEIFSRLFIKTGPDQGKIGNWFLKLLGSREDDRILRWVGGNGGKFETGAIYDDGTNISIGGPIISGTAFNVEGNSRLDGDLNVIGTLFQNGVPLSLTGKFIDGTNSNDAAYVAGSVGIGTINPQKKLDVRDGSSTLFFGDLSGDAALYLDGANGDGIGSDYSVIKSNGVGDFLISTSNIDRFIIDSSGNTGIGTTTLSSGLKLDVEGKIGATEICDEDGNNCFDPSNVVLSGTGSGTLTGSGTPNYVAKFSATGSTLADSSIYDNGSNVGIGTASPNERLSVDGNIELIGNTNKILFPGVGPTGLDFFDGEANLVYRTTPNALQLENSSGTPQFSVDIDNGQAYFAGNVGIGTTTPGAELEVDGNIIANAPTANNHVATKVYVDDIAGSGGLIEENIADDVDTNYVPRDNGTKLVTGTIFDNGINIGVGTATPDEKLSIDGRISLTTDPDSGTDVGNRDYTDARYINVGESINGDAITDGTIDSSEIENNSLTSSDLASGSVGTSEVANNSLTASDLAANSVGTSEVVNDSLTANDLAANSVGNSELIDNPTVTTINIGGRTLSAPTGNYGSVQSNGSGLGGWEGFSINGRYNFMSSDNDTVGIYDDINNRWRQYWDADDYDLYHQNGERILRADENAGTSIYHNNTARITTTSAGATVAGTVTASNPTANTHLTTKDYVDTLVTQGVSWKAPVPASSTPVATYGACDTSREGWATYSLDDDIVYLCNGTSWINIGTTASIPNATTTTPGKVQLAGDIEGTWNNITLKNNVIESGNIVNGTILAADIAADAVNSSEIAANAVGTSEVANNSLTASDLAANSVGNSELIDNPTVATLYLGTTDTSLFRDSPNRIATDDSFYIRPTSPATYLYSTNTYLGNTSGDTTHLRGNNLTWNQGIIQGNGSIGIGTSSPSAKLHVSGNVIASNPTAANHLTTKSYVDAAIGSGDAETLDGLDSTAFLRSNVDDTFTGKLSVGSTNNRRAGIYGTYDSTRVGHIWSMGTAYQIPQNGSNFGNLYGLAYKHTNNPTGGNMAGGHQMVWAQNGVGTSALGTNIWTSGSIQVDNTTVIGSDAWIEGDRIRQNTIDSSEIQNNTLTADDLAPSSVGTSEVINNSLTANDLAANSVGTSEVANDSLTASDLAANSVGNSELIDNPTVTTMNIGGKTFGYPTGNYGSIQINGSGKGGWEGYSIDGRYNFMSSDNNTVGIYDDINDRWRQYWTLNDYDLYHQNGETILHADKNAGTNLYHNNTWRIATTSAGVTVNGTATASNPTADSHLTTKSYVDGLVGQDDTSQKTVNTGWYTIAQNSGNRASGRFTIRETRSGTHQAVHFYAAHHYGNGNTINVLSDSSFGGGGSFRYIRIKDSSTYDGALLQVYVDQDSTPVYAVLGENIQLNGWEIVDWVSSDPISGLSETARIDLDVNNGIQASDGINANNGFKVDGTTVIGGDAWVEGDRIRQNTIDGSEIQNNTLTASDLAENSVGSSELADSVAIPAITGVSTITGNFGEIARSTDEWLRLNYNSTHTSGVYIPNMLRADGGLRVSDDEGFYRGGEDIIDTDDNFVVNARLSVGLDPNSGDDVGDRSYNDGRYVNVGEAINGDSITDNTIDGTEIQDNSLTASDLAPNSVGNSELIDSPTVTNLYVGGSNYLSYPTGNYGSIQINGNGKAGWEGFSINGRYNFMSSDNDTVGIYDDINNRWRQYWDADDYDLYHQNGERILRADEDAGTSIYHNNTARITTTSAGATVAGTVTASNPTANNHLTTKSYVDTLISSGISWKGPVPTGSTPTATYGACNSSKEGWATYNKSDDIVYLCNASAWVSIGSTASIPYATTTSAGKVQLAGDIGGTWNNVQLRASSVGTTEIANNSVTYNDIADGTVRSTEITNNTITETDISDSFVARNSQLLDGINGASLLRSDANDSLTATTKVTGSLIQEDNGNSGYIAHPKGGYYQSTASSVTGALRVCLPPAPITDMIGFYVDVFDYTTNESVSVYAGGYLYQTSGNTWANTSARVESSSAAKNYNVRFGTSGSNHCIWIGETNSTWSYPQVSVRDFHGGFYTDVDQYDDGWTVSFQTGFNTIDETRSNNFEFADWNKIINKPSGSFDLTPDTIADDGIIQEGEIAQNTLDDSEIQDNSLTALSLAASSVGTSEVANNSLTANDLAANSVGNSELIDDPTVNTIYAPNWFRSTGQSGWYNQSYGGGIYMTDSTWVRTYNNKGFYTSAVSRADGGFNVDNVTVIGGDAWVEGDRIRQNTIDGGEIQDNSLTASDLAANSVGTSEVINNSLTASDLAANSVGNSELIDNPLVTTLYLGSTDTALFRDAANRIATDDQLYVRAASANTYLYSTNTYLGGSSGDTIRLRGNTFNWNNGVIQGGGNVGIRTTSPQASLHINDTSDASLTSTNHALTLGSHTSTNIAIDNNEIMARTNGATSTLYVQNDGGDFAVDGNRLRVKNDGKVGIGTSSPTYDFEVGANDTGNQKVAWISGGATNEGGELRLATAANSDTTYNYYFVDAYQDDFRIGRAGIGSDIVLKNSGNVGIGTASPGSKLTVNGRLSIATDPNSADDVGDRGYNDARYINVGESGDSIANNTIDGGEIQDNSLTASDLAANSVGASEIAANAVGNSELIDNPTFTTITHSGDIQATNYGIGNTGVYSPTRYQHVWGMGAAYNLPANGLDTNGPAGNFYGLAWTYNPNFGGSGNNPQGKAGLNHQLLLMDNGITQTAIGKGIWTLGNANVQGNIYANNRIYVDNTTNYLSYPTGGHGSIQINGSGKGAWEGLSIDGRMNFMHDGASSVGIYNDVDNEWMMLGVRNSYLHLYFNGQERVRTHNFGLQMHGARREIDNVTCVGNCF